MFVVTENKQANREEGYLNATKLRGARVVFYNDNYLSVPHAETSRAVSFQPETTEKKKTTKNVDYPTRGNRYFLHTRP